jgi:hypothetical protein
VVYVSNIVSKTVYFERVGSVNTDETLMLAKKRAEKLGIRSIVVASSTGATGVKASEVFKGYNLIIVSHVTGWISEPKHEYRPNENEFLLQNRTIIERNGGKMVTAAHAFGTLGRAVHRRFGAIQVDEIIAYVLRLFGNGLKVACEITCMATDAGLIRTDEEVIGIGGTHRGADTAIVVKPTNTHMLFNLRIKEIICKPRL